MKGKKEKVEKAVTKPKASGQKAVVPMLPPEKRAKGVKLPPGNPTLVASDRPGRPLPVNLAALYEKVAAHKDGIKLSAMCPKSAAGRYARWLVRTLVNMGALAAIPEPKEEKATKSSKKARKTSGQKTELARVA